MGSFYCSPTLKCSNQDQRGYFYKINLTLLEELESIDEAGLITIEEKSSLVNRLSTFFFLLCHLRSKWNPASHNSMGCDRNRSDRGRRNFKVVSRVGFPDVRSKWTFQRGSYLTRKFEVVVPEQQVNLSVSLGCLQDNVHIYTYLDLPLKLGRLGMGLCQ